MAAIALFGTVAYRSLPVSDLPNVDFPTLLVTAQLPGASPETMGSSVATPLENQFSMIAGLDSMTSVNSLGSTQITLVITSNTLPPWTLDDYAETRIAQRISMVSGVAQVQVFGSQKYAVHAQVDPHMLASRQIGINEVETALRNWNVN